LVAGQCKNYQLPGFQLTEAVARRHNIDQETLEQVLKDLQQEFSGDEIKHSSCVLHFVKEALLKMQIYIKYYRKIAQKVENLPFNFCILD